MKNKKGILVFLLGLLIGAGSCLFLCSAAGDYVRVKGSTFDEMKHVYEKYSKSEMIYDTISENYYTDFSDEKLLEGVYKGMVSGLEDPYSQYMTKEQYKDWKEDISGRFDGIGITITLNKRGDFEIISVMDNNPADIAGLRPGDIITHVDGKIYTTLSEIISKVRGEAGTKVEITYKRDGVENTVTMTREPISVRSVKAEILDDNIGYIRISSFIEETAEDFRKSIASFEKEDVKGMVIDIRNNGGGLVDQGIKIADDLLDECVIVCYEDNKGKRTTSSAEEGRTKIPYVLLVDGGTASTSEILAAAVKDNRGGTIIGQQTFGKGIIQNTIAFKDGSALKLTVMQYLSPAGNKIHEKGITPDIQVENRKNDSTDYQLEKAINTLKKKSK